MFRRVYSAACRALPLLFRVKMAPTKGKGGDKSGNYTILYLFTQHKKLVLLIVFCMNLVQFVFATSWFISTAFCFTTLSHNLYFQYFNLYCPIALISKIANYVCRLIVRLSSSVSSHLSNTPSSFVNHSPLDAIRASTIWCQNSGLILLVSTFKPRHVL